MCFIIQKNIQIIYHKKGNCKQGPHSLCYLRTEFCYAIIQLILIFNQREWLDNSENDQLNYYQLIDR